MEKIVLLGATGSVGASTLDVIRSYPDRFELVGVSGYRNFSRLASIIKEFHPGTVCLMEENAVFSAQYPGCNFLHGEKGMCELASHPDADCTIVAVAGMAGLYPTLSAIKSGKKVLTANKESIVSAGKLVMNELRAHGGELIPLDSEHNAIFNMVHKYGEQNIKNIVLTASGGPFLKKEISDAITVQDVLDHPIWDMGNIITVNSATMMNKGFEVIEAHHLFGMDYEMIRVMIHPQSLVHGMAELRDGSHLLFTSPSDMRYPISLALHYPDIPENRFPLLDLMKEPLAFSEPDMGKFPLLKTAYDAGKEGGGLPCALNAANEIAVQAFLDGKIAFPSISKAIMRTLEHFHSSEPRGPEEVMEIDRAARESAEKEMSPFLK